MPPNPYYPFNANNTGSQVTTPQGGTNFNASEGTPNTNNNQQLIDSSSVATLDPETQQAISQAMTQDTLGPNNLLPGQKILDPTTQGLITQYGVNASNTGANFAPQMMSGTGEAMRFLPGQTVTNGNQGVPSYGVSGQPDETANGMPGNNDLTAALNARGQNAFQSGLGALQSNVDFQAPMQEESKLATYNNLLNANSQIENQNYQQQVAYQNQQLQLYNQWQMALGSAGAGVLGAVIGAGGQVAGAAAGAALKGGGTAATAGAGEAAGAGAGAAAGADIGLAGGAAASGAAAAGVGAGELAGFGALAL
jgi:hypothetical protein